MAAMSYNLEKQFIKQHIIIITLCVLACSTYAMIKGQCRILSRMLYTFVIPGNATWDIPLLLF